MKPQIWINCQQLSPCHHHLFSSTPTVQLSPRHSFALAPVKVTTLCLPRSVVWDHLLGSLVAVFITDDYSLLKKYFPFWSRITPSPPPTHWSCFSVSHLCWVSLLSRLICPRVWSSQLFSPLWKFLQMSESGPVTLNTIYMLMTLSFLCLALITLLDSKLLCTASNLSR